MFGFFFFFPPAWAQHIVTSIKGLSLPSFSLLSCIFQQQYDWVTWKESLLLKKDYAWWEGNLVEKGIWRQELAWEGDETLTGEEVDLVSKEAWRNAWKM